MRIEDIDRGMAVELEVVGYQFPDYRPPRGQSFDEWDANWLQVRGRIASPEISWSFLDPCLTTGEARELGEWLTRAALGELDPATDPGLGGRGAGFFVEPNLSVRIESATTAGVSLVWSFSQESTRPGAPESERFGDGTEVRVTVEPETLSRAAQGWKDDLRRFPARYSPQE